MKRVLSFALAAVLVLCLCCTGASAQQADSFAFTRENFPQLDGSTSMIPLGQGIASVLLGESRQDVSDLIFFNRTTQSFRNLRLGLCDVVIAAEPKSEVFEEMREEGVAYELETIAREALVFVVNEDNPVTSLTWEQVKGIYSGAITNWKEVGGKDAAIEAFQRNSTAGSQVMMEKLVMEGEPMMSAPSAYVPQEMGELIQAVRNFDNSASAIGYTVFYYASDMQMAKGLRILKIDGVLPSAETIRSGEYPFVNGYYCCILAEEAPDSPARRLYDWLVSDAGQTLLSLEGYVSVYEPGEAEHTGENIHTDYRAYAPNGGSSAVFTDFDCPKDHLEPSTEYGAIYPYVGSQLYGSWFDDWDDYYVGSLLGFYNHRGQRITDPVFLNIGECQFEDGYGNSFFWVATGMDGKQSIVTRDGSLVTEQRYDSIYPIGNEILGVVDFETGEFDLFDRQYQVIGNQESFVVDGVRLMPMMEKDGGWYCQTVGYEEATQFYVLDADKNVLFASDNYLYLDEKGRLFVCDEDWNKRVYDMDGNRVFFGDSNLVSYVQVLTENLDLVETAYTGEQFITDRSGSRFAWGFDSVEYHSDGCFSIQWGETKQLYDAKGELLFDGIPSAWQYLGGRSLFFETACDVLIVYRLPEFDSVVIPGAWYAFAYDQVYSLCCQENAVYYDRMMWGDLTLGPEFGGIFSETADRCTGETYLLAYDCYGFSGEQRLLTADGKTELFRANGMIGVEDGCFTVTDNWSYTCYAPDGSVIFCYPNYGMGSGD